MKNLFYLSLIIAGFLASSCSSSTPSDSEIQMDEDAIKTTLGIENPSLSIDQNFKSSEKLNLQGVTFIISATNKQPTNSVVISTEGLEVSNQPHTLEIAGSFVRAEVEDMNSDGSPELILLLNSYGSDSEVFAVIFSVNNLKSMSRVSIPSLTVEQEVGYHGGSEMTIVESTLIRRFPIYEQQGEAWVKTDKTRQLHYVLEEGEAMRRFVLDKVIEF